MTDSIIKKRFVGEVLRAEGEDFLRYQEAGIRKKVHFRTGTMINTRQVTVHEGDSIDGMLSYRHVDYERFLDIRRKIRRTDGGYTTRKLNIHNRFSMGAYYSIARELMYGLTAEVKAGILAEMGTK